MSCFIISYIIICDLKLIITKLNSVRKPCAHTHQWNCSLTCLARRRKDKVALIWKVDRRNDKEQVDKEKDGII